MSEIIDSNYETVTARCEHCGNTCIFNRIDDLDSVEPVSGASVLCVSCDKPFWITGDVINTAYRFLLDDAKAHFKLKRYMPAIGSLAQAWEVFFAEFAWSTYVFAPFFATDYLDQDIDDLNALSRRLTTVTRKFTFAPMRNMLINTAAQNVRPMTVLDAHEAIERIETESFGNEPSPALYTSVADGNLRTALEQTRDLTVGELRNHVIHKHAYRPRRAEVEPCFTEEIKLMYRLKHMLNVRDFVEHQMRAA